LGKAYADAGKRASPKIFPDGFVKRNMDVRLSSVYGLIDDQSGR
jgi:hypothetical protein